MLRHLDVQTILINKLLKKIYFKEAEHFALFSEVSQFLFMYCYNNPNNQRSMLPHLNYLLSLTAKDINTPKLISQIVHSFKDTPKGLDFIQFIINKVVNEN